MEKSNKKFQQLTKDNAGKLHGGYTVQSGDVETGFFASNTNCSGGGWFDTNTNCTGNCKGCSGPIVITPGK